MLKADGTRREHLEGGTWTSNSFQPQLDPAYQVNPWHLCSPVKLRLLCLSLLKYLMVRAWTGVFLISRGPLNGVLLPGIKSKLLHRDLALVCLSSFIFSHDPCLHSALLPAPPNPDINRFSMCLSLRVCCSICLECSSLSFSKKDTSSELSCLGRQSNVL